MLDNFLIVFFQVLTLFLLIALGFIGGKKKIINDGGSKVLSDIVLIFVTPFVIIKSFQREFNLDELKKLLICFGCAIAIHIVSILMVHLIFRGKEESRKKVLRFATVFSNAGFMGLPLQEAVLGADGVFYGSVYVATFNIVVWTYGVLCMSGDKKYLSPKGLLFNPGIIGTTIGLLLFIFSIRVEGVLGNVMSTVASLNTPLPMIVIGFYLSQSKIIDALKDKSVYLVSILRLFVIPLMALGTLWLVGLRETVLISLVIGASAPTAAATTMFATKFGTDTELSVNIVSITTLLSIISMPLLVALAQSV